MTLTARSSILSYPVAPGAAALVVLLVVLVLISSIWGAVPGSG